MKRFRGLSYGIAFGSGFALNELLTGGNYHRINRLAVGLAASVLIWIVIRVGKAIAEGADNMGQAMSMGGD